MKLMDLTVRRESTRLLQPSHCMVKSGGKK
jgi:hypothetical protein